MRKKTQASDKILKWKTWNLIGYSSFENCQNKMLAVVFLSEKNGKLLKMDKNLPKDYSLNLDLTLSQKIASLECLFFFVAAVACKSKPASGVDSGGYDNLMSLNLVVNGAWFNFLE